MNPAAQVAAAVNGLRVREATPGTLRYDEMFVSRNTPEIVVGEEAHFMYRMRQLAANDRCRKAAAAHIEAVASRLLGEPWKVGGGV